MLQIGRFTRLNILITFISAVYLKVSKTGLPYIPERISEFHPSEQRHVIDGSASTSHLKPSGYIEQFEISVDISLMTELLLMMLP
jgi:hypothetical protein